MRGIDERVLRGGSDLDDLRPERLERLHLEVVADARHRAVWGDDLELCQPFLPGLNVVADARNRLL